MRETKQSYSEKLRDPRWQKLRLKVMERDGFKCLACGDDKSPLNVHHLIYLDNPWESPIEALETLCEICHKEREDRQKRALKAIRLFPTKDYLQRGDRMLHAVIGMVLFPKYPDSKRYWLEMLCQQLTIEEEEPSNESTLASSFGGDQ